MRRTIKCQCCVKQWKYIIENLNKDKELTMYVVVIGILCNMLTPIAFDYKNICAPFTTLGDYPAHTHEEIQKLSTML